VEFWQRVRELMQVASEVVMGKYIPANAGRICFDFYRVIYSFITAMTSILMHQSY